jgi:hypothetical protein
MMCDASIECTVTVITVLREATSLHECEYDRAHSIFASFGNQVGTGAAYLVRH